MKCHFTDSYLSQKTFKVNSSNFNLASFFVYTTNPKDSCHPYSFLSMWTLHCHGHLSSNISRQNHVGCSPIDTKSLPRATTKWPWTIPPISKSSQMWMVEFGMYTMWCSPIQILNHFSSDYRPLSTLTSDVVLGNVHVVFVILQISLHFAGNELVPFL